MIKHEMPLSQLLDGYASVAAVRDRVISGLTLDSRQVRPGSVFVALRGLRSHGIRFAEQARDGGASCILFEPPLPPDAPIAKDDPILVPVQRLQRDLGSIADRFFSQPSSHLCLVGVTGTNGKTSTVQLLAQALHASGNPVGSIGTLGSGLYPEIIAGERTTPDVVSVHALLDELRNSGATTVAMEVSSHALDQGRVDAVSFDIAVFSNLTQDHLDYHGDMASYGAAKAALFQRAGLQTAVINVDDAFGNAMTRTPLSAQRVITLSSRGGHATLSAQDVRADDQGLRFTLQLADSTAAVSSSLLGRFNVDNLLAVAGCLLAMDWPLDKIAGSLSQLQPVHGRMSRLGGGELPLVVIDYAHTPDALEQTLQSLRAHCRGRLICVFGCGGERDRGKRPQMAFAAESLADDVIVTDDNPRNEDGDHIVAEIVAGFTRPDAIRIERDRATAIGLALAMAVTGDIVLIAGKGHEPYQETAGVRRAFDDIAVARKLLEARA